MDFHLAVLVLQPSAYVFALVLADLAFAAMDFGTFSSFSVDTLVAVDISSVFSALTGFKTISSLLNEKLYLFSLPQSCTSRLYSAGQLRCLWRS